MIRSRHILIFILYLVIFLFLAPQIVALTQTLFSEHLPDYAIAYQLALTDPTRTPSINQLRALPLVLGNLITYLLVLIPILLGFHREIFRALVGCWSNPLATFKGFAFGFSLILVLSIIGTLYLLLIGDVLVATNQTRINFMLTYQFTLTTLLVLLLAPFVEKFIFRWLIFRLAAAANVSPWWTILLSTVSFAIIHVISDGDFAALAPYLTIGFAISLAYQRYRNLWICIFIHSANNIVSVLFFLFGLM